MSLRINNNLIAINAIRFLNQAQKDIAQASTRLSSGLRINSAADDPSGLVISERFRAQVDSLLRAQQNTQEGVSLVQTAEAGLAEISTLLVELRAIAVQSSSGSLDGQTRDQLDLQFQAIISDIDAIASTTAFDTFNPLDDDTLQVTIQTGINQGDTITISGVDARASTIGLTSPDVTTSDNAASAITAIDSAIGTVASLAAQFGITENRLASRSRLLSAQAEATQASLSFVRDADFAIESANLARAQVLQETALSILAQANADLRLVLKLLE